MDVFTDVLTRCSFPLDVFQINFILFAWSVMAERLIAFDFLCRWLSRQNVGSNPGRDCHQGICVLNTIHNYCFSLIRLSSMV